MYTLHNTRDGQQLFISMMEDDHLKNTITLYLGKLKGYKELLDAKINISPIKMAMYGIDTQNMVSQAKTKIKSCCTRLYPYLAEAMLRGIDYKTQLQEIFERTGAEPAFDVDFKQARVIEYTPKYDPNE